MNRRHLLGVIFTAGGMSCQSRPHSDTEAEALPQSLSTATVAPLAQAGFPECTRVTAYAINRSTKLPSPNKVLVIDGALNPDRTPWQGRTLNDGEVQAFLGATTVKDFPSMPMHCFFPRHAIAFYATDGRLLGHYTICFSCQGYRASHGEFVTSPDYSALKNLFRQVHLL
ncbi:hypothetical protein [Verrucomicrobium sp. BvORR106]|uniref:hypothetical protein n=1 Tax=Verrucomicrobium sp. BvORR106 TaxID=1403819 RepID=UPI0005710DC8|nr:hypothetical protein [Verrucomicrobium sp. BvORR106]